MQPVELDQRQLDLGVAAVAALLALLGAELRVDMIGVAAQHDSSSVRLPVAWKCATAASIRWPAQYSSCQSRRLIQRLGGIDGGEPGVEVAIGVLRAGDERDHLVEQRIERGSGLVARL